MKPIDSSTIVGTLQLIRTDFQARKDYYNISNGFFTKILSFLHPGSLALCVFRIQHWIYLKKIPLLNKFLGIFNLVLFSAEMEAEAKVGPYCLLLNPIGIMLHAHCIIGNHCVLAGQITTTLGPRAGFDPINDYIRIGDKVTISSGVRIIGDITIGENTWIGPNTIVTTNLPSDSIVEGKSIREKSKS